MESSKGMSFALCVACLVAVIRPAVGIEVCTRTSSCTCVMSDGSGRYDITALSGTPNEPFFPNIPGRNTSETYSYDPCVPFSLTTLPGSENKGSCDSVAGCRKIGSGSASASTSYFPIAMHFTVQFLYEPFTKKLTLKYTNEDIFQPIITEVVLKCSNNDKISINMVKASDSAVLFELHSREGCLKGASAASHGLSSGSILCIIFSLTVIVYFIGGALFLVFVQNKPVNEAIPNKAFWLELPGLIMEGAKFASSGFKPEPPTHQRLDNHDVDIDDDDDDDEDNVLKTSGGVPTRQSDGFTAVPV